MSWPFPAYRGQVVDVGEEACKLYEEVPTEERVFTVDEVIEMLNSFAHPIKDDISIADIDGYVEHMACGGYVIGRPMDTRKH